MEQVLEIVIIFAIIIVSMMLHELAHGWTAYLLGDDTAKTEGRLSLNPLVHLDPISSILLPLLLFISGGPIFGGAKPVPVDSKNLKFKEWGMALVAIAGPATNFILALVFFLIGHFTGWMYQGDLLGLAATEAVLVNLGFMVFNLIPIPPLDGSRVLYAIAPDGAREVMEQMERTMGIMLILILVVIFSSVLSRFMGMAIMGILDFFYMLVGLH